MRLTYTKVREYRQQQLSLQDNCCDLCGEPIIDDAVLDHDHRSGLIRKVLHRGCNAMLGKIENNLARNRMDHNRLKTWASNLVDYIQTTHTDILHPSYKTKETKMAYKKKGGKKPPKKY